MALAEIGSYYISLVPTAHDITGHIRKTMAPAIPAAADAGRESGGRFSGAFGNAIGGVGHALASALKVGTVAAGAAVAAAGAVGVKTAAQLETAQISFTTMLGSAQKATSFMTDLKNFAAKTPFDLPGLQTSAKSLISIGIGTEKILPIMTTLGNVTSGMGTGSEGIKRATVALQQMNAAQKISAEDLNQLRDAGIPVYELLTKATGKTSEQIAKMREDGDLGKTELEALMHMLETGQGFERFNGLMEAQSASITGLWSTLKDVFGVGMAGIIEPLVPMIKGGLSGAITFMSDTVVPKGTAAMAGFAGSLTGVNGAFDLIGDAWFNLRAGFNGEEIDVSHVFPMPFLEGVGTVFRNIVNWVRQLDFSSIQAFFASLNLGALAPAFRSIGTSITALIPAAGEFATNLAAMTPDVLAGGVNLLAGALGWLAGHTDWIVANMPLIVGGFIAWKIAAMGVNVVTAASVPLMVAANVARTVAAVAEYRLVTAQYAAVTAGAAVNTQQQLGLVATVRGTVATVAHNTAVLASATGARIAAAATWLWNAALSANPLALVIKGVALLAAGFIWFFTQTDIGRQVIAGAWATIQAVVGGVVGWFTGTAMPAIGAFFGGVGAAAGGANVASTGAFGGIQQFIGGVVAWFRDVAMPIAGAFFGGLSSVAIGAFTGISAIVTGVWAVLSGIWAAWSFVFTEILFPVVRALWQDVVGPAFHIMGEIIRVFWDLARGIFEILVSVIRYVVMPIFMALWKSTVEPVFLGIAAIIGWAWNSMVWPIFGAIIGFIVAELMPPFWTFLDIVTTVWVGVSAIIGSIWDGIKRDIFGPMETFLTVLLPAMWTKASEYIGAAWAAVKEVAKAPIKWVLEEVINKGIVGTFNTIADKLPGVNKIDPVKPPDGWRTGGYTGDIHPDNVAGVVHGKEYVLREKATSALISQVGMGGLDYMNRTGQLPGSGYWSGGFVKPEVAAYPSPANLKGDYPGYYWFEPQQRMKLAGNKMSVAGLGGLPVTDAVRSWQGKTGGLSLKMGRDAHHVGQSWSGGLPNDVWGWAAFSKNAIEYNQNNGLREARDDARRAVVAHEIGHMMGLPHTKGVPSIMDPWNTNTFRPTPYDSRVMRGLWPGEAGVTEPNGGEGEGDGGGGGWNPFQAVIDGLGEGIKKVFEKGGAFVDLAVGTATKVFTDVSSWVLDKLGGFWDFFTGGGDDGGDNSNANVQSWATEGLQKTNHFDGMNLTSLIRRIMQESSGDPNAQNNWDSNKSLGGTHGLMQLLNDNFARYRDTTLPNNIYNPLANVVAGINYTWDRYDGNLRKGWDRKGGYKAGGYVSPLLYDDGGLLHQGPQIIDHQRRAPDKVLTDSQWSAMYDIADGSGDSGDVYVQNPFTGDYLIAETEKYAVDATGQAMKGSLVKAGRGGKYRTGRR